MQFKAACMRKRIANIANIANNMRSGVLTGVGYPHDPHLT
jgi:hypothetical protein